MALESSAIAQLEDHGARLRDLESNHAEFGAQLATNTVKLDQLTRTVEIGMDSIGRKFDDFASSTRTQLERQGGVIETLEQLEQERLTRAKDANARRDRRRTQLRTYVGPLMIAAASILGKEGAMLIWHHFHP
jgi:DNA anti-recombination protein RmuC